MHIKELILTSFGKFDNSSGDNKVELKSGINLIYGDNEAGKSTIHKFIKAMLFGFFKVGRKTRGYEKEYDELKPWGSEKFTGVMKYVADGEEFRLERNLLKRKDAVKVYNEKTGDDITEACDYNKGLKIYEPATIHFKINKTTFENTASIGQLAVRTDKSLVTEVKESLINLGGTRDEEISVKGVVGKLQKKSEKIGKPTQKTKPLGAITDAISLLENEIEDSKNAYSKSRQIEENLNNLRDKRVHLMDKRKRLDHDIRISKISMYNEKYENASAVKKEIEMHEGKSKGLEKFNSIVESDYDRIINLEGAIKTTNNEIEELKKEKNEYELEFNDYKFELRTLKDIENIKTDYEKYKSTKKQIKDKEYELGKINGTDAEEDSKFKDIAEDNILYDEINDKIQKERIVNFAEERTEITDIKSMVSKFNMFAGAGIVIAIVLLFTFTIGAIIPLGVSAFMFVKGSKNKKELIEKELKLEGLLKSQSSKIEHLEKQLNQILNKYDCESRSDLKRLVSKHANKAAVINANREIAEGLTKSINDLKVEANVKENHLNNIMKDLDLGDITDMNIEKAREIHSQHKKISREIEDVKKNIKRKQSRLETNKLELEKTLSNSKVSTVNEYKEGHTGKQRFNKFKTTIANKKETLSQILGKQTYEDLELRYQPDVDVSVASDRRSVERLNSEYNKVLEDLGEVSKDISRLEESFKNIVQDKRRVSDIEEEMVGVIKEKDALTKKRNALETAMEVIHNISKDIQREFAPALNEKVEEIISSITDDRYKEVKIDEKLDIKVVEPSTNSLVEVDNLSGGTIDQLYFATRLGILDIIREDGEAVPLILDDCFIQYDDNRIKNILKYLIENVEDRQIIMLSCTDRERELLDELKADYNYVNLSK